MSKPLIGIGRAVTICGTLLLGVSIAAAQIMETYAASLDTVFNTVHSAVRAEVDENGETPFPYKWETAKEAFDAYKDFALRSSGESYVLLKNNNNALPLAKNPKVSMTGIRSYAPIYGNSAGSMSDLTTTKDNLIYDAFEEEGYQLAPSLISTFEAYFAQEGHNDFGAGGGFGAIPPQYSHLTVTDDIPELSPTEMAALNANYKSDCAEYDDAAIVVFGRPGGESKEYYIGDQVGNTPSGNVMGLSVEERAVLEDAKTMSDNVIVLLNTVHSMEYHELIDDPDVDAIMWIGYPGSYGFHTVADVLTGDINPSGHLGNIQIANNAAVPALQSFGNIPWKNGSTIDPSSTYAVNSYLVQDEGIYAGYRYYETRYAEIVNGNENARTAKAGTYTAADGSLATVAGTWDYATEVSHPFGYGLSYTTFTQTLDSVTVAADKKTATVAVTVTNTGSVAGKDVVQVYGQAPYTDYDKEHGIEKSAIQLLDFEKTETLAAGASETINFTIDLANIASYDEEEAKTWIVEAGDYYLAIGDDSHDALNNILTAQGKGVSDGMTAAGNANKAYKWTWTGDVDKTTFATSDAGVAITNRLTGTESSMDLNDWMDNSGSEDMSRNDFNGTFPKSFGTQLKTVTSDSASYYVDMAGNTVDLSTTDNLSINDKMAAYFDCDTYTPGTDGNKLTWGSTETSLTIYDLAQSDFDDERWEDLLNQTTITEFLNFSSSPFHNIAAIPSVGLTQYNADDGPGGSDTHYLDEGTYNGEAWADAADYAADYGTRVTAAQQNTAYTWNKMIAYEYGEIILGDTSVHLGLPIMIGPGVNLQRHGYNGRGGEYLSEDPILSGYIASNLVQGAESRGCLVNMKHVGFNDQEINRSGIAVFMSEQKAREMELRNLQQIFEKNGQSAKAPETQDFDNEVLGIMSSYNRIGIVAPSANEGVMVDILRNEWGFKGYNVTDFTGVSTKAMPKESILYGTTNFCGFGVSVSYWNEEYFKADAKLEQACRDGLHYALWALANSNVINARTYEVETTWRTLYKTLITVSSIVVGLGAASLIVGEVLNHRHAKKED